MARMVEPIWKLRTPRSQKSRRNAWEKEWRTNRRLALERDGHRCQLPGCDRRAQVVHHKAGRRVVDANRLDRLVSLCDACHRAVHAAPEWSYLNGFLERHG
jgi:5-methylcytosine-specific restriction endonuclease McrA